jgi:hypothetical protein
MLLADSYLPTSHIEDTFILISVPDILEVSG